MKYPTPAYHLTHVENALELHSFDGTTRIVAFSCPENLSAAWKLRETRAPMDSVAIAGGFLPFGAEYVCQPEARPLEDLLRETGPVSIEDLVMTAANVKTMADAGEEIDRNSDRLARLRDPDGRQRYDRFCVDLHSQDQRPGFAHMPGFQLHAPVLASHAEWLDKNGLSETIGTMKATRTEEGLELELRFDEPADDPMVVHRGLWMRSSEVPPHEWLEDLCEHDAQEIATGIGTVDHLQGVCNRVNVALEASNGDEYLYCSLVIAADPEAMAPDGTLPFDQQKLALQMRGETIMIFEPKIANDAAIVEMDALLIARAAVAAWRQGYREGKRQGMNEVRGPLRRALGMEEA